MALVTTATHPRVEGKSIKTMIAIRPLILLTFSLIPLTYAISSKSLDSRGIPSDVKYIKCETCVQIAKAASEKAQDLESKTVTELQTLDLIESICDPTSVSGRWMRTIDLVERLRKLRLIPQDGEQQCTRECRTIALSCNAILDGYETELAEKLYAMRKHGDVDANTVESWLCAKKKGVTGACDVKPPFLPRDREKGPEFKKKDEKQAKMDNFMEQMRAMNGGKDINMNMFSKDQFSGGMPGMDDDDDEDDEDEDEDEDELDEEKDSAEEGGTTAEDVGSLDDTSLGDTASEELGDLEGRDMGAGPSKKLDTETGSDEL